MDYWTFNTSNHDRSHIFRKRCLSYIKYRSLKTSGVDNWFFILVVNLTFLQIITSSDFDFECYLYFCLVLNVKLNTCIKFVL